MMKENMHLSAAGIVFERSRTLRANQTMAEKLLWARLSKNQLGVKFRRQHPILSYVVDFYCHSKKLIVELDGSVHDAPEEQFHDMKRTEALNLYGVTVIRFRNEEVLSELDRVVDAIKHQLTLLK